MAAKTQFTNTAYQFQCLQDTFVFTQWLSIIGIALEWKCMVPLYNCKLDVLRKTKRTWNKR